MNRVNSVSNVERTTEEVKKKWSDLSSCLKKKEAIRRSEARKTGGGPAVPDSYTESEKKALEIIGEVAIGGVPHGIDTLDDQQPVVGEEQFGNADLPGTSGHDTSHTDVFLTPKEGDEVTHSQGCQRKRKQPADSLLELEKERLLLEREKLRVMNNNHQERMLVLNEHLLIAKRRLLIEEARLNIDITQSGITQWVDYAAQI